MSAEEGKSGVAVSTANGYEGRGEGHGPGRPRPGSDGEHTLQQRLGSDGRAGRFYDDQVLDHLNERMREFAGQQEMFFLSTADRSGECDSSFRAGPPGFLRVLDERTLVFPEYRGNGVHASLGNIQENPHLGILLIDFVRARIGLHINGRAEVLDDSELRPWVPDLPADPVPGRRALLWVRVDVEEAYIHCAKHIPHFQKAPRRPAREWGTDDYKRKGGDFFGAARDAREARKERDARAAAGAEGTEGTSATPALPENPAAPALPPAPAAPAAPAPAAEYAGARRPSGTTATTTAAPATVAAGTSPTAYEMQPAPRPQHAATPATPATPTTQPTQPTPPPAAPAAPSAVSAAISARAESGHEVERVPDAPDVAAWRQEAERALAEAQRRGREREPAPFQGWFG